MKDCDTLSYLVLPIGATLAVFLITVTTATISCTILNIKLLRDNTHLKNQLKSVRRQRSDKLDKELTTEYYEEVDTFQTSTSTADIDINSNPAYAAVKGSVEVL